MAILLRSVLSSTCDISIMNHNQIFTEMVKNNKIPVWSSFIFPSAASTKRKRARTILQVVRKLQLCKVFINLGTWIFLRLSAQQFQSIIHVKINKLIKRYEDIPFRWFQYGS
jgi:hypothetical protein